jgi:prolyl-tRNA editing enzyme YbaK/EbsC (Cys-tRNA(Pro) deacylase)
MSLQTVLTHLQRYQLEQKVLQFEASSATVQQAAEVLGVIPARIAKTMAFRKQEEIMVVVTAGDAKIDNAKYKAFFGVKAKMLQGEEVEQLTTHPIGGVCPFGLPEGVCVYLDESLKRFDTIFPACGTPSSAIELSCDQLARIVPEAEWVSICKSWQVEEVGQQV